MPPLPKKKLSKNGKADAPPHNRMKPLTLAAARNAASPACPTALATNAATTRPLSRRRKPPAITRRDRSRPKSQTQPSISASQEIP